jgi:hypothetical protein
MLCAAPLVAQGCQQQQDDDGQHLGHSRPAYFADLASTSATWCRLMSQALRVP